MEVAQYSNRYAYRGAESVDLSRGAHSRRCSPGLPTPEASRSSDESIDERSAHPYLRRGPLIHTMISGDSPDRVSSAVETYNRRLDVPSSLREDSRQYAAPESPPWHPADVRIPFHIANTQKPSLPPLKTVSLNMPHFEFP
jgi:hypothetical protein